MDGMQSILEREHTQQQHKDHGHDWTEAPPSGDRGDESAGK
jgi:hypothetical protein